jgi:lipopolysaccharide biosynthesis regulator YciM
MKKPYLLSITAILYLVLTGDLSLAKDTDADTIESFKQAIRMNPDYVKAHFNLGYVSVFSEDRGGALEQYEILKSLDSELATALLELINK